MDRPTPPEIWHGAVGQVKARKVWGDMGGLKRFLMDELIRERNAFAKEVMKDVREREAELRAVP